MRKLLLIIIIFNLFSCRTKQKEQTRSRDFVTFNEGVALNLESIDEQEKGNYEKASELNKKSIEKFRETLKIDSGHSLARGSLAHSLYVDKQFEEAIIWFEQANKVNGEMAANYRELGLCKINLGRIVDGKGDIDKAFSMDSTKEIRKITIQDLIDIGDLAFSYGEGYIKQGEQQKGNAYKNFSIGVLILAFDYDSTKKDIATRISKYAEAIGDKTTAGKYKKLSDL